MGSNCEEPHSLECIKRSDMYPRVTLVCDDPSIQHIPFPLLYGENGLFLGRSAEGVVTLTNFRLHICQRKSFLNIPLRLIESVESRDLFYLVILCKDATTVRCKFSCNEDCQLWLKRISECTGPPHELTKLFAFAFFSHGSEQEERQNVSSAQASISTSDQAATLCIPLEEKYTFSFGKEVERMGFDTSGRKIWRIMQLNEDFSLCHSYPRSHIVPAAFKDEQMKNVASFRSGRRFPSVVWRHQRNGAVIVRCSQPEYGWLGWRNSDDELLLKMVPEACAQDAGNAYARTTQLEFANGVCEEGSQGDYAPAQKMLVIDCRSYSAAFANRAKGGGSEHPDHYTNCEIRFMNMANIHSIRKSFQALRLLCSNFPDHNWLSSLEATKWLSHLGTILFCGQVVVSALEDARPVVVHCSDGWDRTAQISSLAQLLLDPYYRTIQGFQWLVEREWLEFGHKFADRCGHAVGSEDMNEQSPVFLQWLDCVYQVSRQFPCHFQFNEAFLIKLVQHTYSCLFGTFLFNTSRERQKEALTNPTSSVWTLLHPDNPKFHNPLYNASASEVLTPDWSVHSLKLWSSVYLSNNSLKTSSADEFAASVEQALQVMTPDEEEPAGLTKTRSCDNLTTLPLAAGGQEGATTLSGIGVGVGGLARRSSDPNIGCGGDTMALLSKEVDGSQRTASPDQQTPPPSDPHPDSSSSSQVNNDLAVCNGSDDDGSTQASEDSEEKSEEEEEEKAGEDGDDQAKNGDDDDGDCANNDCCREEEQSQSPSSVVKEVTENGDELAASLCNGIDSALGGENGLEEKCVMENSVKGGGEEASSVMNGHHAYNNCATTTTTVTNATSTTFAEADTQTSESSLVNGNHHHPHHHPASSPMNGDHDNNNDVNNDDGDDKDDQSITPSSIAVETKAFESSTDTLTGSEDQALILKSQQRQHMASQMCPPSVTFQNGNGHHHHQNGFSSDSAEEEAEEEGEDGLLKNECGGSRRQDLDRASVESLKLLIQKNCSISTSTTDISDSHVTATASALHHHQHGHGNGNGVASEMMSRAAGLGLGLYIRCNNGVMCGAGAGGGVGRHNTTTPSSSEASPSVCSLVATPVNSFTPPSTCSPTPGSEGKNSESPLVRQLNSVARHLDCDGLTTFVDPALERVQQMMRDYQRRIVSLEYKLAATTAHLNQMMPLSNGAGGRVVDCSDLVNQQADLGEGELSSLGTESNPASDVSWEQVDERDSRITLWVPDHVVTHCAGCGGSFWIGRRKHHCRNCGKVYCYTCSNFFAPVPHQQLAEPVRLCSSCYSSLHLSGPGSAASDQDTRITVGAE